MKRINEGYLNAYEFINGQFFESYPSRSVYKDIDFIANLIGPFQPIVSMLNDGIQTFKPYKSWNDVWKKDILQPLRGIFAILKGLYLVALAIIAPVLVIFITFIPLLINTIFNCFGKKTFKDYNLEFCLLTNFISLYLCLGTFVEGVLRIARGITQILATPLTWFLRIPLRTILTVYYGTPDLFDNEDIQDLVKRSETDINHLEEEYIVRRLHYKFEKAISRGQETALIKEKKQKKDQLVEVEESLHKKFEHLYSLPKDDMRKYFDFFANKGRTNTPTPTNFNTTYYRPN